MLRQFCFSFCFCGFCVSERGGGGVWCGYACVCEFFVGGGVFFGVLVI